MTNLAEIASDVVEENDCTLMYHFLDQGTTELIERGGTSYFEFAYFYTYSYYYFCTHYGDADNAGVRPGTNNDDKFRRVVCPCAMT